MKMSYTNRADTLLNEALECLFVDEKILRLPHHEKFQVFRNILTTHQGALSEDVLLKVEKCLILKASEREWTDSTDLQADSTTLSWKGTKVTVWKGDITNLKIDAIVNAANSSLLGCFVKNHPCVDNQIHFWAGPRLRAACRQLIKKQGYSEPTGYAKVTQGYCLPSKFVIHTVGPIAEYDGHTQPQALASCYISALNACVENGISSVAFCCLSTGVFGYPNEPAAEVALVTVREWIENNPGKLAHVVFNTFKLEDDIIYKEKLKCLAKNTISSRVSVASEWLEEADSILICAGAGMSTLPGYNVYSSKEDFAQHYPYMLKYGYETAYQAMGLMQDESVPLETKWKFQREHMYNMRYRWKPNEHYGDLLSLVKNKEYFVMTTNVDGGFLRSGFDARKIYTPQGDWSLYQCRRPCKTSSVWDSLPMLEQYMEGRNVDVPTCRNCGYRVFGNVRGGSWFIHAHYDEQQERLKEFLRLQKQNKKKLLIIELGAGFNTPTVSRFVMESIAFDFMAKMIRINPKDSEIPPEINGLSLPTGIEVLKEINAKMNSKGRLKNLQNQNTSYPQAHNHSHIEHLKHYFGHFDWRIFLNNLKDNNE